MSGLPIIVIVERDNAIENPDFQDRYIGSVCRTFEEAKEVCVNHMVRYRDNLLTDYINNGVHYAEVDCETAEILKEWFVMRIN